MFLKWKQDTEELGMHALKVQTCSKNGKNKKTHTAVVEDTGAGAGAGAGTGADAGLWKQEN